MADFLNSSEKRLCILILISVKYFKKVRIKIPKLRPYFTNLLGVKEMDLPMNQDKLKNLIASIPTDQLKSDEIEPFIQQMRKHLIEQALQGEMDAHLGYDRYERHSGTNSRNGSSKKTLKTEKGPIAISVPRERDGSFEPQIVPKGQTRTGVLNDQIIALYSKGMSTREISETIKELYDVDVSATLISNVTGRVINEVIQ